MCPVQRNLALFVGNGTPSNGWIGGFLSAYTIFKALGAFIAALVVFLSKGLNGRWAYL